METNYKSLNPYQYSDSEEPPSYTGYETTKQKLNGSIYQNIYDNYKIVKRLGGGHFGSVYEAIRKSDNKTIALKEVNLGPNSNTNLEALEKEISILKKISSPHCQPYLVCFYGSEYIKDKNIYLIEMELVKGVTLQEFGTIYSINPKLNKYLLLIIKDIVTALQYLHDHGIIHNDIKPDNILITDNLVPVVVDMGVSCFVTTSCTLGNKRSDCCHSKGPYLYLSPETIENKGYYFKESDVWSLGMTIFVVVTGKYPFDFNGGVTFRDAATIIKNNDPYILNSSDELLNTIVNRCLDKNISTRITLKEISEMLKEL